MQLRPAAERDRTAARRLLLRRLIGADDAAIGGNEPLDTQAALARALAQHGHPVTQTTVSRDLHAIGAQKVTDGAGNARYRLEAMLEPDVADLVARMRQFVVEIRSNDSLVVVRTPPGAAHSVAVALDAQRPTTLPGLLGTIAGDDTIFIATRDGGGGALAARLEQMMEARK